ncbi:MAG: acyltransferase, partial [Hymenobacter sp.]
MPEQLKIAQFTSYSMTLTTPTEINNNIQSYAPTKRPFNYNLEFLRGVAALLVVYHHTIVHKFVLDPAYMPDGLWKFEAPGHLSVLVFFVLSGYVIRLTNGAPIVGEKRESYLKKRFIRIYPIYALAALFTWIAFFP